MTTYSLITAAAVFAAEAHSEQKRKELNEPYIIHPLRVGKMAASLGQSAEFIAACYLHDVVEDTNVPMVTINNLFPPETCALVTAMTKWWASDHAAEVVKANNDTYYAQILRTPGAPLLKVLDRIDNLHDFAKMARLAPSTHRWAKRYHTKTISEFVPLLAALTGDIGEHARKWFDVALAGLDAAL
jgi:(p)ppGpp synthase/HD superfamily hydrolase